MTAHALIGGLSREKSYKVLAAQQPQVLVGTVGRTVDLYKRGKFSLKGVRVVVVDEADKILEKSSSPAALNCLELMKEAANLSGSNGEGALLHAFSATYSKHSLKTIRKVMKSTGKETTFVKVSSDVTEKSANL